MLPEAGHGAAVTTEARARVSPEGPADPPAAPARPPATPARPPARSPSPRPPRSLRHAAGGAAVFGFLQANHADDGTATERRHSPSTASFPPDAPVSDPGSHMHALYSRFLNRDQSARSTHWQSKAMDRFWSLLQS